jgi:hypothetical protein
MYVIYSSGKGCGRPKSVRKFYKNFQEFILKTANFNSRSGLRFKKFVSNEGEG